jgi:methyl-accepting chemotaxis protein
MRFPLRYKLLLGYLLVIALMLFMGQMSYKLLNEVNDAYTGSLVEEERSHFFTAREVDHLRWANDLAHFLLGLEDEFHGQLDHTQCNLGRWYYNYIDTPDYQSLPGAMQRLFEDMEAPHIALHASAAQVVALVEEGEYGAALTHFEEETHRHLDRIQTIFGDIRGMSDARAAAYVGDAGVIVDSSLQRLMTISIIGVLLALIVGTFLASRITRPIQRVFRS